MTDLPMSNGNAKPVEPYQGDQYDLVARLTWFKDQVECTRPGRELVWMEFDEVIDLAQIIQGVNESMRRDLAKDSPAPRMQPPPPFDPDPTLLKQHVAPRRSRTALRISAWAIRLAFRLLRVPCGDHGGGDDYVGRGRWCLKPFGHSESHAYDNTTQPLRPVRRRFQGWTT